METGREEVEQREQKKRLAEKGAAHGSKRSRKGSGGGKWKREDENWKKKGTENVNEGARN